MRRSLAGRDQLDQRVVRIDTEVHGSDARRLVDLGSPRNLVTSLEDGQLANVDIIVGSIEPCDSFLIQFRRRPVQTLPLDVGRSGLLVATTR